MLLTIYVSGVGGNQLMPPILIFLGILFIKDEGKRLFQFCNAGLIRENESLSWKQI